MASDRQKEASVASSQEATRLSPSATAGGPTWVHRAAALVGVAYLHLVAKTSFVQKLDDPAFASYRRLRRPVIYAFWHNVQVFLAYAHRGEDAAVLVSRSKDGEYIAQVMRRLGLRAERGSSSRGGDQAFRNMIALLEKDGQVGFTPDGPRGPVGIIHGGVVAAATLSGAPIVPVSYASRRKMVFSSWDRFVLPLPFSHVVVSHGKPFCLSASMPEEERKNLVRERMNENRDRAEAALADAPAWGTSLLRAVLYRLYSILSVALAPVLLLAAIARFGWTRTVSTLAARFGAPKFSMGKDPWWFHAASIGEWQALMPLVHRLRGIGDAPIVVTVSTPEAFRLIRENEPGLPVSLLPFDWPWIVRRWASRVRPRALVIIETELWPTLIHELHRRDVPVFIANGRLSAKSMRGWRFFKPLAAHFLSEISGFFVRAPLDGERYVALGANPARVTITGNLKFDNLRVCAWPEKPAARQSLFGEEEGVVVIGGSTWPGEEDMLLTLFERMWPSPLRLILAPRRPERLLDVSEKLEASGRSWSRWSELKGRAAWTSEILLVDTLGDLNNLYTAADVAFAGGTLFPKGGQNPLEAAARRLPVVVGPSTHNFHEEVAALLKAGAASQELDAAGVAFRLHSIGVDADERRRMGDAGAGVIFSMQGAADRTIEALMKKMGILRG